MKTQHTPGPWVARRDGAVGPTSKEEDQSFGMLLPVAYVEDSDWPESTDANAHLIAAAPELLEALKLALEYWRHRQQRYKNRSPVWVQAARAAVAKAIGEEV